MIDRFVEDHRATGVTLSEASEIFRETKRWLWLCAYRKFEFEQGRCSFSQIPLASEALVIDLMWHTFLLFTKDYADFCQRHFGFFIHHYPMSREQRRSAEDARARDAQDFREMRITELRPVYELIHDILGRETLVRWLDEYPKKFTSFSS